MSINGDSNNYIGFDATDHQAAYVYHPSTTPEKRAQRPPKRRKIDKAKVIHETPKVGRFIPLLDGNESPDLVSIRESLFNRVWSNTQNKIQSVLNDANEDTLNDVSLFVQKTLPEDLFDKIPTSFIVTGPNITSQELLFNQLAERLHHDINGSVVTLRSGDAINLRTVLKKLIRDATNQRPNGEDDEFLSLQQDGRKLLNYDLGILYGYVLRNKISKVVVSIQDSEAFDTALLVELVILFSSWLDRIPFVLLFGIATSVELFRERLPRKAARCLHGAQFNVEQVSSILERLFQTVISGSQTAFCVGAGLVSSLMERQSDHIQSVQAFISAFKYAHMCHFFANPLSVLLELGEASQSSLPLQSRHLELVRTLPSFRRLIERILEEKDTLRARSILEDDDVLLEEIKTSMQAKNSAIKDLLQRLAVLSILGSGSIGKIELYIMAFRGDLNDSSLLRSILDALKTMTPKALSLLTGQITHLLESGNSQGGLKGWRDDDPVLYNSVVSIHKKLVALLQEDTTDKPIKSKYSMHKSSLRTTAISQKVQLSQDTSTLTKLDVEFTQYLDNLFHTLNDYLVFPNPLDFFMCEAWLYDFKSPYKDVFTPRPKFVVERALSAPHDYLGCDCCSASLGSLSSTNPPTAILYQLYLETGALINVYDLWSAFFAIVGGENGEGYDEREALMLFYRALADLKSLGMIKQSRKKTDHLAKLSWKGL